MKNGASVTHAIHGDGKIVCKLFEGFVAVRFNNEAYPPGSMGDVVKLSDLTLTKDTTMQPDLKQIELIKVNLVINRQLLTIAETKTLCRALDWINKQTYLAPQYRDLLDVLRGILTVHKHLARIKNSNLKLVA